MCAYILDSILKEKVITECIVKVLQKNRTKSVCVSSCVARI